MHRLLRRGFTLIELLVVLAIVGMLLALAVPRYFGSLGVAQETMLRENLAIVRDAIDKYYSDTGKYPDALEVLVQKRYLRALPIDPLTDSVETWVVVPPEDASKGKIFDIRSGAIGKAKNGKNFGEL